MQVASTIQSRFVPNRTHQALFYPDTHVTHPFPPGVSNARRTTLRVLQLQKYIYPTFPMLWSARFSSSFYQTSTSDDNELDASILPPLSLPSPPPPPWKPSPSFQVSGPSSPASPCSLPFPQAALSNNKPLAMCNVTKNYYIYEQCQDPSLHFVRTTMDGAGTPTCPRGPHERYIVQPGACPLCHG